MEILEHHEKIHEAAHGHQTVPGASNSTKKIAILISLLAALLAIAEMGGKSAQNNAVIANIEASNLWGFFQAKSIRMTLLRAQAEALALEPPRASPDQAQAIDQQIQKWRATADRYDSEPETGEGRKELSVKAKAAEDRRDRALAAYHLFEFGSAAFQLAIVLASASVVTGVMALVWLGGGLGLLGTILGSLALFAPTLLHW